MYNQRLQILISAVQRRQLEEAARRTGTSVAAVVRDAIDTRLGRVTTEQRRAAYQRQLRRTVTLPPPEELEALLDAQFDEEVGGARRSGDRQR